jgi:hypothetical protein
MQQIVILNLSVWNSVVLSNINVIFSGKQSFDIIIIVGVKRTVEIIICHFKIPSIIPEAEDSIKKGIFYLKKFYFILLNFI